MLSFKRLIELVDRVEELKEEEYKYLASDSYPDTRTIQQLLDKLNRDNALKRRLAASLRSDFVGTVARLFKLDDEMRRTAGEVAKNPTHPVRAMMLMLDLSSMFTGHMVAHNYTDLGSVEGKRRCKLSICDDSHAEVPGETEISLCLEGRF